MVSLADGVTPGKGLMSRSAKAEVMSELEPAEGNNSKHFRHSGTFQWRGITPTRYKDEDGSFAGVSRRVFVGESGESPLFHTRYFEVEPGGYTTLERHEHEHVVIVMRGAGVAVVGDHRVSLSFGDVLYIAPHEVHQLSNPEQEPFGFFCLVNAQRDRPQPVDPAWVSACDL